jgi:hypothetical protein
MMGKTTAVNTVALAARTGSRRGTAGQRRADHAGAVLAGHQQNTQRAEHQHAERRTGQAVVGGAHRRAVATRALSGAESAVGGDRRREQADADVNDDGGDQRDGGGSQ